MARTTLATIIGLVRGLVNDPASDSSTFTDDQIQLALDGRRAYASYVKTEEKPTITPGGVVRWYIFYAPCPMWEDGASVVDQAFVPLDANAGPWVSWPVYSEGLPGVGNQLDATVSPNPDLINGVWTFGAQPKYPVMLTGYTHDIWGAAADLLREWAVRVSLDFDVSADDTALKRSQKATMLNLQADNYLGKARPRSSSLIRTDETQDPHLTYDDGYPDSRVNP